MSENPEYPNVPHPNWVALSTCHLKFKKFVKAKEQDCFGEQSVKRNNPVLDGGEIRTFYEDTVSNKEYERKKIYAGSNTKCETIEIGESEESESDSDLEIVEKDINHKLLKAIQNSDFDTVKSLKDCDFNCTDQYGWTALEIGCVVGQTDIVKYLVGKGGYIRDNDRIYRILIEKGFSEIMSILKCRGGETELEIIDIQDGELEQCEECGEMFDTDQKVLHIATITHQLSLKRDNVRRNPGFGISEANVGFRLMKKSGWDGVSGLGEGQGGKLFPVKTILKQDRKGLEYGDTKRSRVTHFGPNDEESVVNRKFLKKDNHNKKLKKTVKRGSKLRKVIIQPEQILREDLGQL